MERFIDHKLSRKDEIQKDLKSSMERFIDVETTATTVNEEYLKSSMERFIAGLKQMDIYFLLI